MNLAEIMTTNFAVVTPQATLADASRRMVDVDTGAAVVVENDRLVGMVSERDLLRVFRDGGFIRWLGFSRWGCMSLSGRRPTARSPPSKPGALEWPP